MLEGNKMKNPKQDPKLDIVMRWARLIRDIILIIGIPIFIIFGMKLYNSQIEILNAQVELLKETQYDRALSLIKSQKELHKMEREKLEDEIANIANVKTSGALESSTDSTSDFELWYDAGTGALQHKRYTKAIKYFSTVLEKKPDAVAAAAYTHNNIGVANIERGEFGSAIENYNASIKLYPQYANAYRSRGIINFVRGKQEKAFKDFNKACILHIKKIIIKVQ